MMLELADGVEDPHVEEKVVMVRMLVLFKSWKRSKKDRDGAANAARTTATSHGRSWERRKAWRRESKRYLYLGKVGDVNCDDTGKYSAFMLKQDDGAGHSWFIN